MGCGSHPTLPKTCNKKRKNRGIINNKLGELAYLNNYLGIA